MTTTTTLKKVLTTQETITAMQLIQNLKKREDNLLDVTNKLAKILAGFTENIETLRHVPNKMQSSIQEQFKESIPAFVEKVKETAETANKEALTLIKTEISKATNDIEAKRKNLETDLSNYLNSLKNKASEETEAFKNMLAEGSQVAMTEFNQFNANIHTALNQMVTSTKENLHSIEQSASKIVAKLNTDNQKINHNQWKWILTVFVSSIATGLLVAWLRTYW